MLTTSSGCIKSFRVNNCRTLWKLTFRDRKRTWVVNDHSSFFLFRTYTSIKSKCTIIIGPLEIKKMMLLQWDTLQWHTPEDVKGDTICLYRGAHFSNIWCPLHCWWRHRWLIRLPNEQGSRILPWNKHHIRFWGWRDIITIAKEWHLHTSKSHH